ncbi:MAG: ribosome-associated translation inhibitor RaiA [Azonexus sp.]|nr:ribosome-associated translation inhibitor RaiA [Azonexus sp.]MDP3636087.1 ribosome-associated translation inhibitor RaiA [Azonexus sp.]MDZ4316248.1 ribosome-associated translation inhibitor RaiA [Azonexus sp.]
MQIVIQARGFELSGGLRQHIERRLRFALDWAQHHVRNVSVRLSDLNGPRGGKDKRCHIQITATGGSNLVIEDTRTDLYAAIDQATDRAGRTLARRVERQRKHPHDSLRNQQESADLSPSEASPVSEK